MHAAGNYCCTEPLRLGRIELSCIEQHKAPQNRMIPLGRFHFQESQLNGKYDILQDSLLNPNPFVLFGKLNDCADRTGKGDRSIPTG
jgi:hypothetical protein